MWGLETLLYFLPGSSPLVALEVEERGVLTFPVSPSSSETVSLMTLPSSPPMVMPGDNSHRSQCPP